jgi:hypothetical protein
MTIETGAKTFSAGQRVRYIGDQKLIQGQIGTFAWLEDHCIFSGARLDDRPGFVDGDGTGWYAREDEMEAVADSA